MRLIALAGMLLWLSACGTGPSLAPHTFSYSPADREVRLEELRTRILHRAPPALLARVTDAQWRREQIGDGVLGPSDFVLHLRFTVPAEDAAQWLAGEAIQGEPCPAGPQLAWWMTPADCAAARFTDASALAGHDSRLAHVPGTNTIFLWAATR